MDIGVRIRQLRKARYLTTSQLAEAVHITQQTISNYENNKSKPSYEVLEALCSALSLTLEEFFSESDQEIDFDLHQLLILGRKLSLEQRRKLVEFLRSIAQVCEDS